MYGHYPYIVVFLMHELKGAEMASVIQSREKRVEIRIRPQDKKLLEKAASVIGLSLSAFMISNALKAAQEGISAQSRISLNAEEWNHFMKVMENPPLPNKALKTAARRHGYV
jgi:uncharacterized protein (DUF1778 family)